MEQYALNHDRTKIDGKHGGALQGAWVSSGRIEIYYLLYGAKFHKGSVKQEIKQCKKDSIFFFKMQVLSLLK